MKSRWTKPLLLVLFALGIVYPSLGQTAPAKEKPPEVSMISAEDLKDKMAKNDPVTIIDVRSTESFTNSPNVIKGAVHVKLRRLKYRLSFPPLKGVPRNQEVVTYCSCPSDESSIAAAQILQESGFTQVRALKGGWPEWLKIKGPVAPRAKGM